jgi:hypothetical protein
VFLHWRAKQRNFPLFKPIGSSEQGWQLGWYSLIFPVGTNKGPQEDQRKSRISLQISSVWPASDFWNQIRIVKVAPQAALHFVCHVISAQARDVWLRMQLEVGEIVGCARGSCESQSRPCINTYENVRGMNIHKSRWYSFLMRMITVLWPLPIILWLFGGRLYYTVIFFGISDVDDEKTWGTRNSCKKDFITFKTQGISFFEYKSVSRVLGTTNYMDINPYLSICIFICLSVCLSVYLFICLSVSM